MLALGKKPARAGAIKFKFETYFDASVLPTPPPVFGRPQLVTAWGLLANDSAGDCVWCDAAHSVMMWRADQGAPVTFSDTSVLSDYSAATGYNPHDPNTDQGTDMQAAASYRVKTGVIDAVGARHKVDAYVALRAGDVDQLALATYIFGAVSVGIQLPSSAMDQFNEAVPWAPVNGARIEGGHCVTCVGRNSKGLFLFVTWGRLIGVAPQFLAQYMDEAVACLSLERLRANVSPQGFDEASLRADLASL